MCKKIDYKTGKNYKFWLNPENFKGRLKLTKVSKTNYGYKVNLFTNYVTLYTNKIYVNSDGSAKMITLVNQNYRAKYQITTYFNLQGNEIIEKNNSTRKELNVYKKLRQIIL